MKTSRPCRRFPFPTPGRARLRRLARTAGLGLLALLAPLALPGTSFEGGAAAGVPAAAKPAIVVADQIVWLPSRETLTARGHVEIFHEGRRLTAEAIIYDRRQDRVKIVGPLRLEDAKGRVTFLASQAELDPALREGILLGARLVIGNRFELAARRIETSAAGSRLETVFASICKPCRPGAKPLWEIRAREVVHDPAARRIRFRSPILALYGTPVMWLPALSVPEPGVRRANGFLVPQLTNSTLHGFSLEVPYFVTLGDHADLTLAPRIATNGNLALSLRWRRRWARGVAEVKGGVASETALSRPRAFLLGRTAWALPRGWRLDGRLELVSDERFMEEYGYSGKDRLESGLALSRSAPRRREEAAALIIRSLRSSDNNALLPTHIVEARHIERRRLGNGDTLRIDLAAGAFIRRSTTDILGRDQSRIAGSLLWQRTRLIGPGILARSRLGLAFDARAIGDDSTAPPTMARALPMAALDLSWPLTARSRAGSSLLVPRAQLVLAPSLGAVPNDDSTFAEIDGSNLFTLDRYAGLDGIESGSRLTLGLAWARQTGQGRLRFEAGQIFRGAPATGFSSASGLSGSRSDLFVGADWESPTGSFASTRISFGTSGINRAETRLRHMRKDWSVGLDHLWKRADPTAGIPLDRNEIDLTAYRRLRRNWHLKATISHDFANGLSSRAEIGLGYEGDCARMDLSLSHNAASSTSVSASTSVSLRITFRGLGADAGTGPRQCGPGL